MSHRYCPTCKQPTAKRDAHTNYALVQAINALVPGREDHGLRCRDHGEVLQYMCRHDRVLLRGDCLLSMLAGSGHVGHEVVKVTPAVSDEEQADRQQLVGRVREELACLPRLENRVQQMETQKKMMEQEKQKQEPALQARAEEELVEEKGAVDRWQGEIMSWRRNRKAVNDDLNYLAFKEEGDKPVEIMWAHRQLEATLKEVQEKLGSSGGSTDRSASKEGQEKSGGSDGSTDGSAMT